MRHRASLRAGAGTTACAGGAAVGCGHLVASTRPAGRVAATRRESRNHRSFRRRPATAPAAGAIPGPGEWRTGQPLFRADGGAASAMERTGGGKSGTLECPNGRRAMATPPPRRADQRSAMVCHDGTRGLAAGTPTHHHRRHHTRPSFRGVAGTRKKRLRHCRQHLVSFKIQGDRLPAASRVVRKATSPPQFTTGRRRLADFHRGWRSGLITVI